MIFHLSKLDIMKQLFDIYERKLILAYYKNPNMWYQKPSVVKNLEMMRLRRTTDRIYKNSWLYNFVVRIKKLLKV